MGGDKPRPYTKRYVLVVASETKQSLHPSHGRSMARANTQPLLKARNELSY